MSGHWLNDELRAIVSTTVDGFLVKGSGDPHTVYAEHIDDNRNLELVAALGAPVDVDDVLSSRIWSTTGTAGTTGAGNVSISLTVDTLNLDALADRVADRLAERTLDDVDEVEAAEKLPEVGLRGC